MPRHKEHKELLHLSDIEYQRALNRINANACYKRKQIVKLKEKLARLEGTVVPVAVPEPDPEINYVV